MKCHYVFIILLLRYSPRLVNYINLEDKKRRLLWSECFTALKNLTQFAGSY